MATLADLARRLNLHGEGAPAALPPLIVMTDSRRLADPTSAVAGLERGCAVILRHYGEPGREEMARWLAGLCRRLGLRLLIAGDGRLAAAVGAGGVHLPEAAALRGPGVWSRWRRPGWLVTAAAHSPAALFAAVRAGADAALLSPVFATPSHPDAHPLGPLRFAAWCRRSPLPVYALGGISPSAARRLAGSGAVGLAGIGMFR